jgi:hypothetical protein
MTGMTIIERRRAGSSTFVISDTFCKSIQEIPATQIKQRSRFSILNSFPVAALFLQLPVNPD